MNRTAITTMVFACCLAGTGLMALRQMTQYRRTVTIERWTDHMQMVSFGTDRLLLRSSSEIWNDLRYRWELRLLEDREVWNTFRLARLSTCKVYFSPEAIPMRMPL